MTTVRSLLLAAAVLSIAVRPGSPGAPAPAETRLMRFPDIWHDQVVFVYAGDLWVSSTKGGLARRLTSHPGDELYPKFSPDGQWIAFTGEYDGNSDVYVVPASGGEPKRLTYHPASDMVLGWSPDGRILFRSTRASDLPDYTRLFLISPEGGVPEMLSIPRASLASFSSDGQRIAYNMTSQEMRTWKRYRGGWKSPIAIFDLTKHTYEPLPTTEAMDMFPMWRGNAVYFISDRDGVMNLYRYDLANKRVAKLTSYTEYDIKWPSLGPDAIAYENGGLLYSYDLQKGKASQIPIFVASDEVAARPELRPWAAGSRAPIFRPAARGRYSKRAARSSPCRPSTAIRAISPTARRCMSPPRRGRRTASGFRTSRIALASGSCTCARRRAATKSASPGTETTRASAMSRPGRRIRRRSPIPTRNCGCGTWISTRRSRCWWTPRNTPTG